ncbi:hypothetical protein FRB99_004975 [Tulasnella sp. 403]|nr:hypothetical protein FRB99_004975 [Tulasnella sp. 403]
MAISNLHPPPSPAARLPPEILEIILYNSINVLRPISSQLHDFAAVSVAWHRLIIGSTRLWRKINFFVEPYRKSSLVLAKSKPLPLDVYFIEGEGDYEYSYDSVEPEFPLMPLNLQTERWRSLTALGPGVIWLAENLDQPIPALRELSLNDSFRQIRFTGSDRHSLPPFIDRFPWHLIMFGHLQRLVVRSVAAMPWSLLASALASCQLKELVLEEVEPQDGAVDDKVEGDDVFYLDQLEVLSVINVSSTLANGLVGYIRAPSLQTFELDMSSSREYTIPYTGGINTFDALMQATPLKGESLFASLIRRHPHDLPVEISLTNVLRVSSSNTDDHPGCRFKIELFDESMEVEWFSRIPASGWTLPFVTADSIVALKIHLNIDDCQDLADATFLDAFPTLSELWIPATWHDVLTRLSVPQSDVEGHLVWTQPKLRKLVLLAEGEDAVETIERLVQTVGSSPKETEGDLLMSIQIFHVPWTSTDFLGEDGDVFADVGQFILPRRLLYLLHWDSGRTASSSMSARLCNYS